MQLLKGGSKLTDPITISLSKLTRYFVKNEIPYVIVGGVEVLVFGRTRLTNDIDIIVDHTKIIRPDFIQYLQSVGFDANLSDLISFDEGNHCSIFLKEGMFRIDIKGKYTQKDEESILGAVDAEFNGIVAKIDNPSSIVLNKLIFGSEQDYEDALAVYVKNNETINDENLRVKSKKYQIENQMNSFLKDVNEFLSKKRNDESSKIR